MGWENVFHCEMNPFGQRVLAHHFPNSKLHEDVKTFPSSDYVGRIDILTGGFPCQPYSTAGKRLGKDDDRHLWPFMLEIIRTIQPRYVVGENVRGLVNWNGGLVFDEVQSDLEAAGYEVLPFILPAAAVGAPHRRDRVWFVAYANDERAGARFGQIQGANGEVPERDDNAELGDAGVGLATDPNNVRLEPKTGRERQEREREGAEVRGIAQSAGEQRAAADPNDRRAGRQVQAGRDEPAGGDWAGFPTQPPVCGGDDGLPRELDGITFPKWRAESIKAYGNAIVPQVALQIFKAIQQTDDTLEQD